MSTVMTDLQIGANGLLVQATDGTQGTGKRLSLAAPASGGTAEVELTPATDVSQSGMNSQIIWFGKTGTDYERFAISEINQETRIDSTANHAGAIRNVIFIMGGYDSYQSTGKARAGQNALILVSDASVRLQGSSFTIASSGSEAGGSYGSERTTVYDFGNTGTSRLIVGTRQSSPNTALFDEASIEYMRSNVSKWRAGLNASSGGADSFEWYSSAARMTLTTDGKLGVGVVPGYLFHAQKAVSGDAIAKIYNSATDGYGFVLRNGDNTKYAMTVQNADASANAIQMFGSGNITCVSLTQTSDERLKKNVKTFSNALPLVRKLRSVNFEWSDAQVAQGFGQQGVQHVGVIAQELEKVVPDLVAKDEEGVRSVDYGRLSVILLQAVKELDARLESLAVGER